MKPGTLPTDAHGPTRAPSRGGALAVAGAAALLFAAALLTRTGILGLPPIYDELYHLLPAMSLQDAGTFAILDGSYERGALYTRLVAASWDLAGTRGMGAARLLPSAVPGALLVVVATVWVWRVAGLAAAAVSAVFLLLWPNGIEVSQYVRFYALHGLATLVAVLLVYEALCGARSGWHRSAVLLAVAGALMLFALRLQQTTLIVAAAAALWAGALFGPSWLRQVPWLRWAALAAAAAAGLVLASGALDGTLSRLWTTYRWEPWPILRDTTFYHRDFRDNYATFWSLFPFAALIALRARFVPASFCLVLFGATFLAQSFGGLKNIRYLYPTMPFFFAIWAIALAYVGGTLLRYFGGAAAALLPQRLGPRTRRAAVAATLAVAALFAVGSNNAVWNSARLVSGAETRFLLGKRRWQWEAATEMAAPWLERGAVVVTTEEMLAVQWLGDFDVALNRPRFSEMEFSLGPGTRPYAADFRTGRPIVATVEELRPLVACRPVGIVVANAPWIDGADARRLGRIAAEEGAEVTATAQGHMSLLGWSRAAGARTGAGCDALPGPSAAAAITAGARQPKPVSSASAER
ncbi:hypothetical protein [Jannaschia sp. W003]|uniref:hypothetical protein n=1 Tax=Jannaschia sp. W003 TaxID=2867012 RepID=UPI0021A5F3E2|nr:hypothetical protein [Jannaschia sp. W003]UWQ21571.1 hypothetical protein K3554_00620 [Jannaschia sp. W003]